MIPALRTSTLAFVLFVLAAPASAQDRVDAWSEDLFFLVERFDELHPDPYHALPQEEFEQAVGELYERIPDLTDDQVVVELMRLLALHSRAGKEGHCAVRPMGFRSLPIVLYRFADGWFVVEASAQHADLVGARLLAVEGSPVAEVVERVTPLVCHDNATGLLQQLPTSLVSSELLHALGLTASADGATLTFDRPAREAGAASAPFTVELVAQRERLLRFSLPPRGGTLWSSRPGTDWWFEPLPEERALYVQFNVTQAQARDGTGLVEFARDALFAFREHDLERLVLDLRFNGGGNNGTFGPLVQALATEPGLRAPGTLFALTGRGTFSAAGNLVAVLARDTSALLVGEPSGGAPNQFGDARSLPLPNHADVLLRISTRYHEFVPEEPDRVVNPVDVAVPLTSADYFAGRDPVLEAALRTRRPQHGVAREEG